MHKILFVCHGNICRSTMAQCVMTHLVNQAGRSWEFMIDSAATSREEIGNPPHHGTVKQLKKMHVAVIPHKARQVQASEYDAWDYIIGMDAQNMSNLQRIFGGDPDGKIYSLLSFAGEFRPIADPWYTGDFETTYADVLLGCKALLETL